MQLSPELWQQVQDFEQDLKREGAEISWRKIASRFDCSQGVARGLWFALKNRSTISGKGSAKTPVDTPSVEREFSRDTATITTKSLNIQTLDQALEFSEVDLSVWEVERYTINTWEVTMGGKKTGTGKPETYTNYQVKAWLKRRVTDEKELVITRLIDRLAESKTAPVRPLIAPKRDEILMVPGLVDHHFGALAWGKETGEGDYDLKIAEDLYIDAVNAGIDRMSGFEISQFLLPVGSDFFHLNDPSNATPKNKNNLDVDGRLIKVFEVGEYAVVRSIERMAQVAPVKVVWIPGNHDPEISFYLCKVIAAYFRNDPNVEVDVGPQGRKFHRHGDNLLGMCHGDDEPHRNLPTIMADSCPQWWGECAHKEWLVGHIHKKKELNFVGVDSFGGTTVRFMPSLCKIDQWHYRKGYVGGDKSAEILAYDMHGLAGYFPIYQRKIERRAA